MSNVKAFLHVLSTDNEWVLQRGDKTGGAPRRSNTAWTYAAAAGGITDTADVTLKAAPGVGNAVYLTGLQIANKSATATEVVIKSASTVLWRGYAPATSAALPIEFDDPLVADNNTALTAACITNATATLINAQGYTDIAYAQLQALATSDLEELFADDGTVLLSDSGAALTV